MRGNYSAIGRFVVYIKSTKDTTRAEALLAKALNGRAKLIDKYVGSGSAPSSKQKIPESAKEKRLTIDRDNPHRFRALTLVRGKRLTVDRASLPAFELLA